MSAWPDPSRPGVPLNPERDGWHWLRSNGRGDVAASWQREALLRNGKTHTGVWWIDGADYTPTHVIAEAWHYLGPCLTPADHAAAVQAERAAAAEAMRKHAASRVWTTIGDGREIDLRQFLSDQIRALPLPDTSALAAAVEAARREEREACAELSQSMAIPLHTNDDWPHVIARAIRARSGGKEGA